jgi:hypothetical protein
VRRLGLRSRRGGRLRRAARDSMCMCMCAMCMYFMCMSRGAQGAQGAHRVGLLVREREAAAHLAVRRAEAAEE